MVRRSHVSVCIIIVGIVLLTALPYLAPTHSFNMNSYHSTVGLWDLRYELNGGTSNKTTPPKNYFLPPDSSREDTFLKCGVAVGARSVYVQPASLGEVYLRVDAGTISICIFDENNSVRWRTAQPYTATLEARDTGTTNLTFPIPIDPHIRNLTLILVNNSGAPENVTVGGRLQLVAEWAVSTRDPLVMTVSLFLGPGMIICGIALLIKTSLEKRTLRRRKIENRSKYLILLVIVLSVSIASVCFYAANVSKTSSFNQELSSLGGAYPMIQVSASLQDLSRIRKSLLADNPDTLPLKQVHSFNDFKAVLEQRPVSTLYYNTIDRAMWVLTLQPGEPYTYEMGGKTYTYQPMIVTVVYYVQSILLT